MDPTGYRPVSITPALSRLAEKILNEQLSNFLSKEKLIPEECHGFVGGRSCVTACLEILQELSEGIEEGGIPTLLGCDISSAFDCLPRSKLLKQISALGCGENAVKLLSDYFNLRTQQVEIGGQCSTKRAVHVGVLQGSALSPLLFLIYFLRGTQSVRDCQVCIGELKEKPENRSNRCSRCGSSVTFADDLNTIHRIKGKSKKSIERRVEQQGNRVEKVLRKLGLCINKKKTQLLICMNRQRRNPSCGLEDTRERYKGKLTANIGGQLVEETGSLKTLGVLFDSVFSF